MDFVIESLSADWESFQRFAPRLVYAAVLFVISLVAARIAGRQAASLLGRSARLKANRTFVRHIVSWIVVSIGVLLALGVMGFNGVAASLLATGGVAAIVVGFAFREIGENILAGLFLMFSRPFEIGDLVRTGDLTGIVESIDLRHVHVRAPDGSDVFVPSAMILREPLHNYTRDGLRRPGFTIGIAYHDDPDSVLGLLENAVAGVRDVLREPPPIAMIRRFAAHYVEYEVFFWVDEKRSERTLDAIETEARVSCWRALRDSGMTFSTNTINDSGSLRASSADASLRE